MPLSSHLAANHFNQQQAEQEERMRMKKLTLDINERQEQEDYQGKGLLSGGVNTELKTRGLFRTFSCSKYSVCYRDDAVTRPAPSSRQH